MARLDYSKWDHIEVSDDEDDTHPNIDTPSLFRWRHQARMERDTEWKNEKSEFDNKHKDFLQKYNICKQKLITAKQNNSPGISDITAEMKKLEAESEEWREKEVAMQKKERLRPWNIDTICKEGKSKTIINTAALKHDEPKSKEEEEEAMVDRLKQFVKKNDKDIKKFGMFQRPLDSQNFLVENPHLVCEETANQLVLWCIDLAMEEKFGLMDHVSHQCIVMQFMLELAKSLKCDPRACVRPFFSKFINPEPEYHKAFDDELSAFRQRIRTRAKVRLEEAMQQLEEEEKQKRLGPGGMDPVEVFESLPVELQDCFEKKDVELLKEVLCKMSPEDAEYHMKRCVDSGLWVDNVANSEQGGEEGQETAGVDGDSADNNQTESPSKAADSSPDKSDVQQLTSGVAASSLA